MRRLTVVLMMLAGLSETATAATKNFNVNAQRFTFTFTPMPFVVNQGDTVNLDIVSLDTTHGFFLEQYFTEGVTLPAGQHKTITFVATTAGTFTYQCTVSSCGSGHGSMRGQLVVNAAPSSAPTVTSFTPHAGPIAGGTVVAINGTNFQNGATVKFGEAVAVSVMVNSATRITAVAPAHDAGEVAVMITNPDGQSVIAGTYAYTLPSPAITSIIPSIGGPSGGTRVTISGSGFDSTATVTFGGAPGTDVQVTSATSLMVTTPPHAAGIVDVVVTVGAVNATSAGAFMYQAAPKKRRSVRPQ